MSHQPTSWADMDDDDLEFPPLDPSFVPPPSYGANNKKSTTPSQPSRPAPAARTPMQNQPSSTPSGRTAYRPASASSEQRRPESSFDSRRTPMSAAPHSHPQPSPSSVSSQHNTGSSTSGRLSFQALSARASNTAPAGGAGASSSTAPFGNRGFAGRAPAASRFRRETTREQGIVVSVKDGFGFIKCAEREEDMFFPFSEFPNNVVNIGAEVEFTIEVEIANNKHSACEVVQLPQGTVKFETLLHEKANGQLITAAVASFAGSFRGREAPARPGFIRLTIDGQPAGQVEYSASQVVSSGNGTPTLRAGDSLEFDVYVDRRTAKSAKPRMRAHRVRVLAFAAPVAGADSSSPVVREPGIVVAVKQGFGFVRCVDREGKDVYFSQSEVAASAELTEGAEVELEIEQDRKGQLVATRISQLPKGTIQMETIAEEYSEGVVTKALQRGHGNKRRDFEKNGWAQCVNGVISSTDPSSESGATLKLGFNGADLAVDHVFLVGDRVRFRIATPRRPAQPKRATHVELVEMTAEGKETGVITSVSRLNAVIKCADRNERLLFSFDERIDDNYTPAQSDEVSFFVCDDVLGLNAMGGSRDKDSAAHVSHMAVRIAQLPRGSVVFDVIGPEIFCGVVQSVPTSTQPGSCMMVPASILDSARATLDSLQVPSTDSKTKPRGGKKAKEADAADTQPAERDLGADAEVCARMAALVLQHKKSDKSDAAEVAAEDAPFASLDLSSLESLPLALVDVSADPHSSHPGCAVRVGDVVTGRIKRYKPTGRRSWTSVRLSVPVPTGRVRGIVTVCKDSYGFLRLETVSAPDAELANPAEDIWFPFSELIDRHRKVRIGDELSFNVEVGSKGKSAAARLAFLPKGSIPVSESSSSSTSLSGVVVEEIRRTFNRSGKKPHGLIEAGSATYEFRLDDLVNKKVVLKVGDLVDFKATGSSVNAVKLRPRVGFVESIVDAEINVRALPDVVGAECTVADLVARASRWELFPFSTQSTEKTEKTGDSTVADVTASLDAVQLSAFVVDQLVEFDIGASRRHNSTGGERAALSLRQASSDVTQKYLALAALLPEVRVARQAAVDENKSSIDLRKSMTAEKRKATLQAAPKASSVQAKGPDGSAGFGAGRGRSVNASSPSLSNAAAVTAAAGPAAPADLAGKFDDAQ